METLEALVGAAGPGGQGISLTRRGVPKGAAACPIFTAAMSCSLGTVRSRLHRGRKLLRAKIAAFERDGLMPAGRA